MDAVKYMKGRERMCDAHEKCETCPLNRSEYEDDCVMLEREDPEEAVRIVEEWGKENPAQTRKDVLLGTYPKAELSEGIPKLCPRIIAGGLCEDYGVTGLTYYERCEKCRKKYWMEEV